MYPLVPKMTLVALTTFVLGGFFIPTASTDEAKKLFVCYWDSSSYFRPGKLQFTVSRIDPRKCTHLIYGFATLKNKEISPYDPFFDLDDNFGLGMYKKFVALKKQNPDLKTLINLGGRGALSQEFSKIASDSDTRSKFVVSVMQFLLKHGFDGLDLQWEFFPEDTTAKENKDNFAALLEALHHEFESRNLVLSAVISPEKEVIDNAYDLPRISRYVSFFNVMSFGYANVRNVTLWHHAPIKPPLSADGSEISSGLEFTITYLKKHGIPVGKLVMGIPLFGISVTSGKNSVSELHRKTALGYNQICSLVKDSKYTIIRNENVGAPIAVTADQKEFVAYDDVESVKLKALFARDHDLRGVLVWSIENDDFLGTCNRYLNPLQTSIKDVLRSEDTTVHDAFLSNHRDKESRLQSADK